MISISSCASRRVRPPGVAVPPRTGLGIEGIHVHAYMQPVAMFKALQRLAGNRPDPPFIDIAHRIYRYAALPQAAPFFRVKVADADHHDILRSQLGAGAADIDQFGIAVSQQRRQRHAVDVAGDGRPGGVEVAVGGDPDQSGRF